MLNEIEKTDNFLKAITKYAEEQRKKTRQEADSFKQKELEKAEREALKEAYEMIRKEMTVVKHKVAIKISERELEAKKNISKKREKIIDSVFHMVKVMLSDFTSSNEYINMIEKSLIKISNFFDKDPIVLLIRKEDEKLAEKIKSIFNKKCTIEISKNIKLGGIKAKNFNAGIFIDETLDTKLKNQKEWFYKNCANELGKENYK